MKAASALAQIQDLLSIALKNQDNSDRKEKRIPRSIRFAEPLDAQIAEAMEATGEDRTNLVERCVAHSLATITLQMLDDREAERRKLREKLKPETTVQAAPPVVNFEKGQEPPPSAPEDRKRGSPKKSR